VKSITGGAYRSKEVIGGSARLCLLVAALSFWKENFVVSLVSLVRLERRNPTTRTQ
jgi:hypothetical protein